MLYWMCFISFLFVTQSRAPLFVEKCLPKATVGICPCQKGWGIAQRHLKCTLCRLQASLYTERKPVMTAVSFQSPKSHKITLKLQPRQASRGWYNWTWKKEAPERCKVHHVAVISSFFRSSDLICLNNDGGLYDSLPTCLQGLSVFKMEFKGCVCIFLSIFLLPALSQKASGSRIRRGFFLRRETTQSLIKYFFSVPWNLRNEETFSVFFLSPVPQGFAVGELSCHFLALPSENLPIWHSERLERCKHQQKPWKKNEKKSSLK